MPDDFGFYGKGIDGYVHYNQAVDESFKKGGGGGGPRRSGAGSGKGILIAISVIIIILWVISHYE